MARLGRPPATDSAETRKKIVDAARAEFAAKGYAAASITGIANVADLAPSAVYHYFGGKQQVYEAVFDETTEGIWSRIGPPGLVDHDCLRDAVADLVAATPGRPVGEEVEADFLALVPIEAKLHPEFVPLLERRSAYQDERFGALAELGLSTGELAGFTLLEATEIIRSVVMGWFFERHLRGREIEGSADALIALIEALASRTQPST